MRSRLHRPSASARRRPALLAALVVAAALAPGGTRAQPQPQSPVPSQPQSQSQSAPAPTAASTAPWPARPLHLVIPFPPGGPNDISARLVATALGKALGQPVVPENRPGAGGNVAAEQAARAAPDGYTLFWAQSATHGTNPALYRQLRFDPVRDFAPIGMVARTPLLIAASPASPYADLKSLLAAARAQPGRIQFGSGGNGTTPHMAGELLGTTAGVKLAHVPYRGSAQAVSDTMGGHLELVIDGLNAVLGQVKAGRLRPLAVTGEARSPALPEVPAVAELLPGYQVTSWGGLASPAGTPPEVIARLSKELMALSRDADLQAGFEKLGARLDIGTPDAMAAFVREEIAKWRRVVEQTGARID